MWRSALRRDAARREALGRPLDRAEADDAAEGALACAAPAVRDVVSRRGLTLRRSARARRFSLSVSRIDGAVRVSAPARASDAEIGRFLDAHAEWLSRMVEAAPEAEIFGLGESFPYLGRLVLATPASGRGVRLSDCGGRLLIGGGGASIGARVEAWLREEARRELVAAARGYAEALDRPISRITLRDTRSRWGSCSARGALSFSWRLVMAPRAVLDYVAAHEAAHLVEMNHSSRFWAVVERLRPTWRTERDWLRRHGATLHRYRAA